MKSLKITAIGSIINPESNKKSFAVTVDYEGRELAVWRTEKQMNTDIKRSGIADFASEEAMNQLVGGTLSGNIVPVKAGDEFTVTTLDEKEKEVTEVRKYKSDGLNVSDGFLSFELSMNKEIANAIANKMAAQLGL